MIYEHTLRVEQPMTEMLEDTHAPEAMELRDDVRACLHNAHGSGQQAQQNQSQQRSANNL